MEPLTTNELIRQLDQYTAKAWPGPDGELVMKLSDVMAFAAWVARRVEGKP